MAQTNLRHGGTVLSATLTNNQVVIFDRPESCAGQPGTILASDATGWTEEDWRRLANQRTTRMRKGQRKAGMHRRMSAAYAAEVLGRRNRAAEGHTRETWERVSQTEVCRYVGGILVETYYRERVPGMGSAWAAYPIGYQATVPA
jgi:hypothetical protein